jgi:hypothetical protein
VATGKQFHEFPRDVRTAVFAPDSKLLWAGGPDFEKMNQLALWDLATDKELPTPRMGSKYGSGYRLAFSQRTEEGDRD